jgi:hypothetical protein
MRFFDINYALKQFPGTSAASSQSANAAACFDGLDYTRWISNEEDTDGDAIYVERDFINAKTFNKIFIKDTNILNISLKRWTGAAWVALATSAIKSQDSKHVLFEFATQSIPKIRIIGSNTIAANEEKEIQEVFCFSEIGRLIIPPADIKSKRNKKQDSHQLENSKYFIFNRGRNISIDLNFKSHLGQTDIDLLGGLFNRDTEFYVWINDNEEQYMVQKTSPFRFEDVLKMSLSKGDSPSYYKNLFFSGINNKIRMVEAS